MSTLFDLPAEEQTELPALRGSPKQCCWASAIRRAKLTECEALLKQWSQLIERHHDAGRADAEARERGAYTAALDRHYALEQLRSAGGWIDARDSTALELLQGLPPKPGPSFFPRDADA